MKREELERQVSRSSFGVAWGERLEGKELRQIVVEAVLKRGDPSLSSYIKFCLKDVSLRELKRKR